MIVVFVYVEVEVGCGFCWVGYYEQWEIGVFFVYDGIYVVLGECGGWFEWQIVLKRIVDVLQVFQVVYEFVGIDYLFVVVQFGGGVVEIF